MHVHAYQNGIMRTTVDMKAEHRSALLAMASRRGQKGFSDVLGEAIEDFIKGEAGREKKRATIRSVAGSLTKKEAEELRLTMRELRESWR
jgi:hypothetical protein